MTTNEIIQNNPETENPPQTSQTRQPKRKKNSMLEQANARKNRIVLEKANKQRKSASKLTREKKIQLSIKNFLIKDETKPSRTKEPVQFTAKRQLSIEESFGNSCKKRKTE